jgi:hypothetical protein
LAPIAGVLEAKNNELNSNLLLLFSCFGRVKIANSS